MNKGQKGVRKPTSVRKPVKGQARSWFGADIPAIDSERRNWLIAASVGTKILIAFLTVEVFKSFLDMFGHGNNYHAVQNILSGLWPWANGTTVNYPPLAFIPMFIAYLGSLVGGFLTFVVMMWILMAICDLITTIAIYYIGLQLYSERTAFIAALVYATAFSAAYFSFTVFDAFPVMLAALALLFTVYGAKTKGYLTAVVGLFAKLWPMVLFPFLWVYNAKDSSVLAEGRRRAIGILVVASAAFVVMVAVGYNTFLGYTSLVYSNTIPYLASVFLPAVPFDAIVNVFRVMMVVIILGAIYWMYRKPGSISRLVKMIFLSIFVLVFLIQYRSPQYTVWLMPFAALLVAGDAWGILIFFAVQVMEYLEFPLTFYSVWVNEHYVSGWAIPFFITFFIAYGLLLWRAMIAKMGEA